MRSLPLSLGALALVSVLATAGCKEKHVVDDTLPSTGDCSQTGRADDIVKKTAIEEFKRYRKTCELYDLALSSQNPQDTVWRVCCGEAALMFVYYPAKCVARRTSSTLITCQSGEPMPPTPGAPGSAPGAAASPDSPPASN